MKDIYSCKWQLVDYLVVETIKSERADEPVIMDKRTSVQISGRSVDECDEQVIVKYSNNFRNHQKAIKLLGYIHYMIDIRIYTDAGTELEKCLIRLTNDEQE